MNESNRNLTSQEDKEMTIKEIILKVKEYFYNIKRHWFTILVLALVGGIVLGVNAYFKPTVYPATITFMVNEESGGGGMAAASALLGQFGLGGSSSEHNYEKIIALAKSNKIIGEAILDSNYKPKLGNQIIEIYNLQNEWKDTPQLSGFTFQDKEKDELAYNMALDACISIVRGTENNKGIANIAYSEETGILSISVSGYKPEFSISLANALYNKLSEFYIQEAIEKPRQNYRLLKERADSISKEVALVESQLARLEDRERNLLLKTDRLNFNQLQRSAQILTIMYAEVLKNKETANFILKSETPFFQIVDISRLPLNPQRTSVVKFVLFGSILFGFLTVVFIAIRLAYTQVMSNGTE